MPWMKGLLLFVAVSVLTGCALILGGGTSETVSIATNPPGATCSLTREGKVIASMVTPSGATVKKSKHNINILCKKEGYQDATGFLDSGIESATWGNIVLGGGVGWAIDSMAGADNDYPEQLTITLVPIVNPGYSGTSFSVIAPQSSEIWRTLGDDVRAYGSPNGAGNSVVIPRFVPLTMVEQRSEWGLFEYSAQNGSRAKAWIPINHVNRAR